jgi:SpoVK/Ycf46/Vps4 family AAA+-type ATPase
VMHMWSCNTTTPTHSLHTHTDIHVYTALHYITPHHTTPHRRLVKRIYVPLPDEVARAGLIQHLMRKQGSGGGGIVEDVEKLNAVVKMTAGYSGSDLSAVCTCNHLLPILNYSML